MRIALITGINGQDGSYLAEHLLTCGYDVWGTVCNLVDSDLSRLTDIRENLRILEFDLSSTAEWEPLLDRVAPAEIYNLAARASSKTLFDNPVLTGQVNGLSVGALLEAARKIVPETRICQASSREIFGDADVSPQNEGTPARPRNPYGAAKHYADTMIRIYREHYALFACSAILFNHESPRRSIDFVTRKITSAAARIKLGSTEKLHVGNLNSGRDWGYSADFVEAMRMMLQQDQPDDYVLATGQFHTVRDVCTIALSYVGLDYSEFVIEDSARGQSSECAPLIGDASKARRVLNWSPTLNLRELIEMMVDNDLRQYSE